MDFGVGYFPTHDGIGPGTVAKLVEDHGFESLFFAEHSHIPASRESPYPGGEPIPRKYYNTYDLFVALTAAALATNRLRVASGICLVIQRDPIHTAKETASVDHISGGRFEFGVGAGWNREEMSEHGTDPRTRMRRFGEYLDAIVALWTQEEATYHGEFANFDRAWSYPKPVQRPHPPILVGGDGPTVEDRVIAHGTAWIPNYAEGAIERHKALQEKAGRPIELQFLGAPADPRLFEQFAKAGVRRVCSWTPSGPASVVEAALAPYERAIAEFNGEI
jgi:probable F420-dependent oxidoreductase